MRGWATRIGLVAALLCGAAGAQADDATQSARAHYTQGTKLYDLGRYHDAAKEYEAAFELRDDPALLFNIAQAYRLGHDYADSIRAYKSFLRRVPATEQRAQVEARIHEMQEILDKQPQQPPPVAPVVTPPPAVTPPPPAHDEPRAERTPLYKKWWLWTLVGGVVVAGAVVGITVGVLASRSSFNPSLGTVGPAALTVRF
jgi:tetratricopeptide (TPR) repeat protein